MTMTTLMATLLVASVIAGVVGGVAVAVGERRARARGTCLSVFLYGAAAAPWAVAAALLQLAWGEGAP